MPVSLFVCHLSSLKPKKIHIQLWPWDAAYIMQFEVLGILFLFCCGHYYHSIPTFNKLFHTLSPDSGELKINPILDDFPPYVLPCLWAIVFPCALKPSTLIKTVTHSLSFYFIFVYSMSSAVWHLQLGMLPVLFCSTPPALIVGPWLSKHPQG